LSLTIAEFAVPEATMNKHRNAMSYKDYICIAWQFFPMKAKSVTHAMEF